MGGGVRKCVECLTLAGVLAGCGQGGPTEVVDVQTRWHDVEVLGATRRYRLYAGALDADRRRRVADRRTG